MTDGANSTDWYRLALAKLYQNFTFSLPNFVLPLVKVTLDSEPQARSYILNREICEPREKRTKENRILNFLENFYANFPNCFSFSDLPESRIVQWSGALLPIFTEFYRFSVFLVNFGPEFHYQAGRARYGFRGTGRRCILNREICEKWTKGN